MFSPVQLIWNKRQGRAHSAAEIEFLVNGYLRDAIPAYQVAAWLMAVYFRGLDPEETHALTQALVRSGRVLDLSAVPGVKVDKHSTGGVGDKTTLVVVPLAAACGAKVVKLAGRALGHTGGTLDKLEAIPGLRVELTVEEIIAQAQRLGAVIAGHSGELVPADKKLYALRDVTATADCPPLIAASIMSKKIAGGADAIVLDVKVGEGGFLPNLEEARALAKAMVDLGRRAGRPTVAILSRMDEPLGYAVGNALEVEEAVAALKGRGPQDLVDLSLTLAAHMVHLAGRAQSLEEARGLVAEALASGRAWEKFRELVAAQGGDPAALDGGGLPRAGYRVAVKAPADGYIQGIAARRLGEALGKLGASRQALGQAVDPAVGIVLGRKVGDYVRAGEELAVIHAQDQARVAADALAAELVSAWHLSPEPPAPRPLVYEVCT